MSFPRYPTYKRSGVEWLGEVPEHWGVKPLKTIASINDEVLPESLSPDYEIEYVDIGSVSLANGIEKTEAMPFGDAPSRARRIPRDGDVLVSTVRTYLKAIAPVVNPPSNLVASTGFAVVRPRHELEPGFLKYALQEEHFIQQVISRSTGVSYPAINASDVAKISLNLPGSSEQLAIATFLDHETAKIDALIAEQQRLIELLQEKRQAVISHAVTKGLNPDAPMKNSGVEWLGEVPEHWRNFRLKALFALKHGYAFDGSQFSEEGEYALMTPGNFIETGGFRRKDPEKYYVGSDMPSEFILQGGEMLIAMTEQAPGLVGTALIAPEGEHYLHNQRLGLVTRLKAEELDTSFLYWLMNSPVLKAKVGVTAAGQKVRHTSPQKILDNEICLPPLEEQRIIAQALFEANERCIKLTENACTSIQLLVERRSALISAAVTGQIDVQGLVPEAVAA